MFRRGGGRSMMPVKCRDLKAVMRLQMSRSTRRGLSQILRACGLGAEAPTDDPAGSGFVDGKLPASLRAFLPAAAEMARQRQGAQMGPRHRLSILRTALRLGRKVSSPFPSSVSDVDCYVDCSSWADVSLMWLPAFCKQMVRPGCDEGGIMPPPERPEDCAPAGPPGQLPTPMQWGAASTQLG